MSVLTSKEVSAKLRGKLGHFADGNGLYLVVPSRGARFGRYASPPTESVNK